MEKLQEGNHELRRFKRIKWKAKIYKDKKNEKEKCIFSWKRKIVEFFTILGQLVVRFNNGVFYHKVCMI